MNMKTNYHTHNYLCGHAIGTVEDYVKEAILNNYSEIGISDHGPLPIETFYRMSYEQFLNLYLPQFEVAKQKYKDQIKIYIGLEIEYLYYREDYYKELLNHVDYLIFGSHYFSGLAHNNQNSSWGINTKEKLYKYGQLVTDGVNSGFFKVLAHPDIFMNRYQQFDSDCEKISHQIIEACIKNNVFLEVNANGIRNIKKYEDEDKNLYVYPNVNFWKIVAEYPKAKVIISSDCHAPELLNDEAVEAARRFAKYFNLNIVDSIFDNNVSHE